MWARVDKIDRIRPQPGGGAIVLVEDERNAAAMARVPSLSTLIAIARILDARRVLELRYRSSGEVRYAAASSPPMFLVDAITRAGAHVTNGAGDRIAVPAAPASVSSTIDLAFSELAHHVRTSIGPAVTIPAALHKTEERRRKAPLDVDAHPAMYWTAVFELTALAGELSRPRGGRWIDVPEMPVPFAIRLASGELARPARLAQRLVAGQESVESLASEAPDKPERAGGGVSGGDGDDHGGGAGGAPG
ncbi:MAG TPA: hypothetical protein VHT91_45375 [Kofleriaceae bacterium]|nr:hypothetical protein [Kofleriaceae bacterium]